MDNTILLVIVLTLVLVAEMINGWSDAPNAIATVISTRTLSIRNAIIMATVLNIAGAFFGTAVAATIGQDIINANAINLVTLGAAISAVIIWGLFTWSIGLPNSKSHSLVAGLTGAGIAYAGPSVVVLSGWYKVIIGLFFSTILGALGGFIISKTIEKTFHDSHPGKARKIFGHLQILSASLVSFSHGSNDGQKFIGVFSLALLLGGFTDTFVVYDWVIVVCALTMGLGTSMGGRRIIKTMGYKIARLETYQGFSAEAASASTILLASHLGIPLSTTHTIGTAIMGVGMARHHKQVRWSVVLHIVYAWLLTFPISGLLAYSIAYVLKYLSSE